MRAAVASGSHIQRPRLRQAFLSLALLLIGLAWIYPFAWMASTAFKGEQNVLGASLRLIPTQPTLANFVRAWTVAHFDRYLLNTFIIAGGTVLLTLLIVTPCGYAIGRYNFAGRRPLVAILAASLFVPPGYIIVPLFEVARALGLLNTYLGVILSEVGSPQLAVFILLAAGYFSRLPNELAEAAQIDGCGFAGIFWRVMLPLGLPILVTICIMQTIYSWNSFLIPLIFTLSAPDLRPISVGMFAFQGEYSRDLTGTAAAAVIGIVPIVLIFLLLQRYFISGIAGAVKG